MKKKLTLLLVLALALSTVLAACSSSTSSGTSETLIFGRGGDSVSLDPANVTDGESIKVTKNIFEGLLTYEEDNTEVVPALATEWSYDADNLVWTFTLREGVKFHDGTDFNAEAVVFNFNRWMDKDHEFHIGDFPYYGYMFGGYKGDEGHVIKEVVATGDYTVEIHLNNPQGPFLNNVAMAAFGIASPAAIKEHGENFGENPVGTGPFKFVEWKRDDSITVEKNEDYWQEGLPKLDKVIFKSIPENSARFIALQNGDIDIMDGVNAADLQIIESDENLQQFLRPSMNVGYLAFNTEKEPFNNKKVRQALNHAVDKNALIDTFYGGLAEPAKNPLPPSLWGYNDSINEYEFDLEKAKQLLAEAGYPDGFETDFWAMPVPRPYMPQGPQAAEQMAANFEKIGVKTEILSPEWGVYLERTGNGEHQMAMLGWTGDNGDPDNFLYVLLDSDNAKTPDAGNIAFYKNDQVHDLLIQAQRITDLEERTKLYEQAQEIIHEDAPWVPLVHSTPPLAANVKVKGFVPHPTGSDVLANVYFEN
jgi:peptide/nickel transport system substrate-binding protein